MICLFVDTREVGVNGVVGYLTSIAAAPPPPHTVL